MAQAFNESLPLFTDTDEAVATPLPDRLPSYIADHRKRLRTRFIEGGANAVAE